jgi:hypothetical protein
MTRQIVAAALALVLFAVAAGAGWAQTPEKRVALVIGNDAYQTLPRLVNATSDARDLGRALEGTGFDTTIKTDVKRRELYQLIDAFAARIAGSPDTVGLFYYAGHGVQTNGKNYLVPVDANLTSEADLEAEAVDYGKVLRAMEEAHNRINIVILDACRDNPLPKGRSLARGLASVRAPRGTFIGYAAAPGQTAQDGEPGQNGVFTGTLIKHLGEPGLQIEEVFKRVIAGVSERTGGKQLPWMESSVQGNFYFISPNAAPVTPSASATAPPSANDPEIVFWQSIPPNAAATDYEEYLRQYPQGRFAGLARNRLAALRSPPPKPEPSPSRTPPLADEELAFWKTTMAAGAAGNFEEYLQRYPQGRFSDIARYQIAALRPPPPPVSRDVSRNTSLCGRLTDYVIDISMANTQSGRFLGAWTGKWNNASGMCGALVVNKIYPDGRADVVYIYGPGKSAGSVQWKRQNSTGAVSDRALSFRDDQGGEFDFIISNNNMLDANFSRGSAKLQATFEKLN